DQLTVREVARRGSHRLLLVIDKITGEVSLAVIEVLTHEYREVMLVAIADAAGGNGRLRRESCVGIIRTQQTLDIAIVLVVLAEAVLPIDLNAFEVLLENEIDDACDGIGAIGGRRSTRHYIDPLDQRHRYLVYIGRDILIGGAGVTSAEPAPVDQHERALRTQAAQVHRREASGRRQRARRVTEVRIGSDDILRQLIHQIRDVGGSL